MYDFSSRGAVSFADLNAEAAAKKARKVSPKSSKPSIFGGPPADVRLLTPSSQVEAFKELLVRKYGNLGRAWRFIDLNRDGKLSFKEFTDGVRAVGFPSRINVLFDLLKNPQSKSFVLAFTLASVSEGEQGPSGYLYA